MTTIGLLTTALLFGGMVLNSFGFAAFVFSVLPSAPGGGQTLRRAFPHFYVFVPITATVAAAVLWRHDRFAAALLALIALTTLPTRQILMPAINAATDTGAQTRFKILHGLSVVITFSAGAFWPEDFGLILVNAVQYQCSLGVSTERYRDAIFRAAWDAGGRLNFGERIKQLVRTGDVVVNCCTKGNDFAINTPLRSLVETEVRRVLPGIRSIRRMHPASWRVPSWIETEWRYNATEENENQMSTIGEVVTGTTRAIPESVDFHKKHSLL